ncbi:MAG: hypothetical protein ACFFBD_10635, partial [Candidatus Hodarchaeota archaeon]
MRFVGINIGSISLKIFEFSEEGHLITSSSKIINHQGHPVKILDDLKTSRNENDFFGVSGHLGHISETQAIERALLEQDEHFDAIFSLGGEAFTVYLLRNNRVFDILAHNRCAAGSGEFLVQQIGRLNLSLSEAILIAKMGKSLRLASRCSVHCKSDVTHKLN